MPGLRSFSCGFHRSLVPGTGLPQWRGALLRLHWVRPSTRSTCCLRPVHGKPHSCPCAGPICPTPSRPPGAPPCFPEPCRQPLGYDTCPCSLLRAHWPVSLSPPPGSGCHSGRLGVASLPCVPTAVSLLCLQQCYVSDAEAWPLLPLSPVPAAFQLPRAPRKPCRVARSPGSLLCSCRLPQHSAAPERCLLRPGPRYPP